jgi:hypothetical protein
MLNKQDTLTSVFEFYVNKLSTWTAYLHNDRYRKLILEAIEYNHKYFLLIINKLLL